MAQSYSCPQLTFQNIISDQIQGMSSSNLYNNNLYNYILIYIINLSSLKGKFLQTVNPPKVKQKLDYLEASHLQALNIKSTISTKLDLLCELFELAQPVNSTWTDRTNEKGKHCHSGSGLIGYNLASKLVQTL